MQVSITIKVKAIKEVKEKGRLIGDVAAELNIPKRQLFKWLTNPQFCETKRQGIQNEIIFLQNELKKIQIRLAELNQQIVKSKSSYNACNDNQHLGSKLNTKAQCLKHVG